MDKTKTEDQERNPSYWGRHFQVGVLTVVNTGVFFVTINRFQENFWRVLSVQTIWTLLLGLLYSLFLLCIFASFSNLYQVINGQKDPKNNDPLPVAYALFIVSLVCYLFIELYLNLLIAINAI